MESARVIVVRPSVGPEVGLRATIVGMACGKKLREALPNLRRVGVWVGVWWSIYRKTMARHA